MPTLPLTARTVATLRAPSDRPRIEYFDADVPGLTLRITSDNVKTWTLMYRHHDRKRRLTLGRFPDLGLADARRRAIEERGRIASGVDPVAARQDERSTFGDTVGALYHLYKKASEKKRSWSEQRRIFENQVLPVWRHLRVADIRRRDIRSLVDRKAETAPVMANRMLSRISRLFSFAVERDWIEANPALRIGKPSKERSRDRVLSRNELRDLWAALHQTEAKGTDGTPLPRLSAAVNDAFIVMLLTAQRGGEVCRMRWEDVDLDSGSWTIPAHDSKNGDPHRVPLVAEAVAVLSGRLADADEWYVFSNHRHTSVAARAKKAAAILSRGLSFAFRAHDLRRTAASYMGEAGVDRFHIAHVLNHRSVTHSTVTAIYDRYRYDKEKRAALQKWVEALMSIVGSGASADKTATSVAQPAETARTANRRFIRRPGDRHSRVVSFSSKSANLQ
jgi:integrase